MPKTPIHPKYLLICYYDEFQCISNVWPYDSKEDVNEYLKKKNLKDNAIMRADVFKRFPRAAKYELIETWEAVPNVTS